MKRETQETLDRVAWLDVARLEARRREPQELLGAPAFDWARVDSGRWRFPRGRLPRLVVAGLLILGLGSAAWAIGTVTWRRWHAEADHEMTGGSVHAMRQTSASLHRQARLVGPAPLAKIPTRAALPPSSLVTVERSVRGALSRSSRRAPRAVAPACPKAASGESSSGPSAVLPKAASSGRLRFGEELILVRPRAKLKPLFTPEDYKKRH